MAQLKFDGMQPVNFGGKDCQPKLDAELRLRLGKLNFENSEADKILAECFPDDEKYVADFLKDKMTPFEKRELQAYLIGGPSMIRTIRDQIGNAIKTAQEAQNE